MISNKEKSEKGHDNDKDEGDDKDKKIHAHKKSNSIGSHNRMKLHKSSI